MKRGRPKKRDTANKRSEGQKEDDRKLIAKLFLQNVHLREITQEVNRKNQENGAGYSISYQQVHYDIKLMLAEWREARQDFIDDRISIEIAKLDKIEAECWIAWEQSKQGRLKTRVDGGAIVQGASVGGSVIDRTIETSVGDVRFLDRIQACIDKRVELLGMSVPKKIDVTGNLSGGTASQMTDEELAEEVKRLMLVAGVSGQ